MRCSTQLEAVVLTANPVAAELSGWASLALRGGNAVFFKSACHAAELPLNQGDTSCACTCKNGQTSKTAQMSGLSIKRVYIIVRGSVWRTAPYFYYKRKRFPAP